MQVITLKKLIRYAQGTSLFFNVNVFVLVTHSYYNCNSIIWGTIPFLLLSIIWLCKKLQPGRQVQMQNGCKGAWGRSVRNECEGVIGTY